MASKGQKFNNYTKEFKEKVVLEKTIKGNSYSYLSRKYNIPDGTIRTWVRQFNTNGGEIIEKPRGRQNDETIDYKERYEILKKFQAYVREVERKKK